MTKAKGAMALRTESYRSIRRSHVAATSMVSTKAPVVNSFDCL
jgi:hypothetical protein